MNAGRDVEGDSDGPPEAATAGAPGEAAEIGDEARRALIRLSAAVAGRGSDTLLEAIRAADREAPAAAVEECLLQAYLFLGFPAALTALGVWRDVVGPDSADSESRDVVEPHEWRSRGERVCRIVYGRAYEKLRGNVRRVNTNMDRWMIEEGYGKVLGRPGLDLATREACIVSILAVTGWESQLHSHLRGALNAGCAPEMVGEALEEGLARSTDGEWIVRARDLWRRVGDRAAARPERS